MNGYSVKPAWHFYPVWIVLSAGAVAAGAWSAWQILQQVVRLVGQTVVVSGQQHITEDYLFLYLLLPVIGIFSGVAQSLWLRRSLPQAGGWALATLVGWLLPFGVGALISALFPAPVEVSPGLMAAGLALVGGSIGLPQWLVLRPHLAHAWLWLVAQAAAWGMVGLLNQVSTQPDVLLLVVALLPALTTALAWWVLFNRLAGASAMEENV